MKTTHMFRVLTAVAVVCSALTANALEIESGAYSIADNFVNHDKAIGVPGGGSHKHASNEDPVDPENSTIIVANAAEVGGFFGSEEVRGLAEFDLTGRQPVERATLLFDVANVLEMGLNSVPVGGLYGQEKYVGDIAVIAYEGNNREDLDDFQAPSLALVGRFNTDELVADDTLDFDISQIFNEQIDAGIASLGIRLEISPGGSIPDEAITFDNLHIEAIPEPSTFGLAYFGLIAVFCGCGRHGRHRMAEPMREGLCTARGAQGSSSSVTSYP